MLNLYLLLFLVHRKIYNRYNRSKKCYIVVCAKIRLILMLVFNRSLRQNSFAQIIFHAKIFCAGFYAFIIQSSVYIL